ncbi:mitochondrial translation protein [Penicillium macrosclerotiorum]|uniref:mitochondrial translation protein n=1 Tax=Penicillium macrosclerotiorum TaxID=303699 RepID=UPI002546804C|nr:mitochondrial translation protein [Penicillium macrosclerotiorum]KAJ5669236.1 mitochondrial translation protein [Penicillium macrosclerotiorum]
MFRASLRSVADPIRDHVCLSCLARRFAAPTNLRQFHRTPALRTQFDKEKHGEESISESTLLSSNAHPQSSLPSTHIPESSNGVQDDQISDLPSSDKVEAEIIAKKAQQAARQREKRRLRLLERAQKQNDSATTSEQKGRHSKKEKKDNPVLTKVAQIMSEASPGSKEKAPKKQKGKLSHVANFINEKHTGMIDLTNQKLKALDVPIAPVPRLSFGLDRVLFNPGVYQLRDPRSRVYNFDPYLGQIMPVTEFDFNTLKDYITSSKDETLRNIAVQEKKKYVGSSSSMTSVLSQFHYLLSSWRGIDARTLSQGFPDKLRTFTRLLRSPAAMFLHYQDGVYAIDADKEFDSANILMNLGKSMEKLLTMPKEDFERYRRSSENKISAEEEQAIPESYHYSTFGDFIMRSQLDAYDPRLPGTGMFDLKTRAVVSIRMDAKNFEHGLGYEIKHRFGAFESFEREYYDMIRAAFLKYSLQVRVGRMDGIFVAFHNVERIFGFQYVSLPEMDQALHGSSDTALGDHEFQLSLGLWNEILNKATAKYPKQSLRFHFETRDAVTPFMYIFVEPVTDADIKAIQTKNKAEIDAYQQRILNLTPSEDDSDLDIPETEAIQETETIQSQVSEISSDADENGANGELLAMVLTARNKINGEYVERPMDFKNNDTWNVEYEISDLAPKQGHVLYKMCKKRRQTSLLGRGEDELEVANNVYIRRLRQISKQGRKHRERENKLDAEQGVVVLDGEVN